jgi:transposase InsO family protein
MRLVYTGERELKLRDYFVQRPREAHSKKVEAACYKYGVLKKSIGEYTPQHNAIAERWFRTFSEMSTCQMLQYDMPEAYWEDSRRMATFIYHRVPPVRLIPGKNWEPPIKNQYPTRETMNLTKLQTFGIECWVYQK